jgi:hypothetical protein
MLADGIAEAACQCTTGYRLRLGPVPVPVLSREYEVTDFGIRPAVGIFASGFLYQSSAKAKSTDGEMGTDTISVSKVSNCQISGRTEDGPGASWARTLRESTRVRSHRSSEDDLDTPEPQPEPALRPRLARGAREARRPELV